MVYMVQKKNIDLEVILVLLSGRKHLREISRVLKVSHSTVLRKIEELIKKNILDYEIQGKNKVFFIKNNLKSKNYIFSAEQFILEIKQILENLNVEEIMKLRGNFLELIK